MAYQAATRYEKNSAWITDPRVPDPEQLPNPLGWCLLVRPYPIIVNRDKTSLIVGQNDLDFMNYVANIGKVIKIGPCCWNRPEHKNKDGERFDWVKEGDFVAFSKSVGARRKYKGVSYVLLVDDDVIEKLDDPQFFSDQDLYKLDIPEDGEIKKEELNNDK